MTQVKYFGRGRTLTSAGDVRRIRPDRLVRECAAYSVRCYHARAQGRVKDNCQFVCEEDPDGMDLHTLQGEPFLAINGIQTLSHTSGWRPAHEPGTPGRGLDS